MTIIDEAIIAAPVELCFRIAADVERWPIILPHYRRVHFLDCQAFGTGIVEMAAWRDFAGPLRYPVWWRSRMWLDTSEPAVYYRHVAGVTTGMDVKWMFTAAGAGDAARTHVAISHAWDGPPWPLIGRFAWEHVIARRFVSFIATRTLAGVAREAERLAATGITA